MSLAASFMRRCVPVDRAALAIDCVVQKLYGVPLYKVGLRCLGIRQFENEKSDEEWFVTHLLPRLIEQDAILFDVGANNGDYAQFLLRAFPKGRTNLFEPQKALAVGLRERFRNSAVEVHACGLGAEEGVVSLFKSSVATTQIATTDSIAFRELYGNSGVEQEDVVIRTLDSFCRERGFTAIDFVKMDTEGAEYAVLLGSRDLLSRSAIKIVQFEFGQNCVYSRVFMRDFYQLLPNYVFYRIAPGKLIPLGNYSIEHEVFQYQNVVALRRDVAERCEPMLRTRDG